MESNIRTYMNGCMLYLIFHLTHRITYDISKLVGSKKWHYILKRTICVGINARILVFVDKLSNVILIAINSHHKSHSERSKNKYIFTKSTNKCTING